MQICFATNNPNKLIEVQSLVPKALEIVSLVDIGCLEDVPEDQETIEGNSIQKARYVYDKYAANCFADDTGLEVDSLDGAPGVYSARYAGAQRSSQDNMSLLLQNLEGLANRKARFKTVISLIIDGDLTTFEGVANGHISNSLSGTKGFGYDPVFIPDGYSITFAEMSSEEKNKISHRGLATKKLIQFLNQY